MSLFVEVNDKVKGCPVIINLDQVVEISPLVTGGCELSFSDGASVGGRRVVNVTEEFTVFQQLVMHMVTPKAMDDRIAKIKADAAVLRSEEHTSELQSH